MSLRRKTRWLAWSGLAGSLIVAVSVLAQLYIGTMADREHALAAVASAGRRITVGFSQMANSGEISQDAAQKMARSAILALAGDFVQVRLGDSKAPDGALIRQERLPAWDWTMTVVAGTDDIGSRLLRYGSVLALLLAGLLALALRMAGTMMDGFVAPIEALAQRLRRLGEGRLDLEVPSLNRPDEIGAMARAVERFRQTARDLREREERLSGILASVDESILLIDADGVVRHANGAARRLFGREPDPADFADLFADSDRKRAADMMSALRAMGDDTGRKRIDTLTVERGGERVAVSVSLTPLAQGSRGGFVAVLADVTEHERSQRELMRMVTRDRLTGLSNRAHVESALEAAVTRAWRESHGVAVLCFDLSRFKLITDTLGHRAGDALLVEVARRLRGVVGDGGTVGRMGVDDFAVILDPADEARADALAKTILTAFDTPVALSGTEHFVRPAIGLALFPQHATTGEDLIRAAEIALYASKRRGGMQSAVYEPAMGDRARRHLALDQEMRRALGNGEFRLHYQPKVSLVDFSIEGFEALLRWDRPGIGLVAPGDFLGVAEDTGFIATLDEWVLDEACRQVRAWTDEGLSPLPVAVNVSPHHLRRHSVADFQRALIRHGLPASLIEVEVTENAVMQDLEHAMKVLNGLQELGIGVAVDDFGTGHSSLSYLKQLPVTTLKIDRSFIDGIPKARNDAGIVATIISMANLLKLKVIAEGVERPEQAQFLRHNNCVLAQGWLTGRPMPAEAVVPVLATRQRLLQRA
jgi:diguanylate cyclase